MVVAAKDALNAPVVAVVDAVMLIGVVVVAESATVQDKASKMVAIDSIHFILLTVRQEH